MQGVCHIPLQVLDEDAMNLIRDRGEAPVFFEACLKLLSNSMRDLHAELDRQAVGYYKSDMQPTVYDLALGVRLAEASSQVWEVWEAWELLGNVGNVQQLEAKGARAAPSPPPLPPSPVPLPTLHVQVMWGSAYLCAGMQPMPIRM